MTGRIDPAIVVDSAEDLAVDPLGVDDLAVDTLHPQVEGVGAVVALRVRAQALQERRGLAAVARVIGPVVERARRAGYAGSRRAVGAAGSTGGR